MRQATSSKVTNLKREAHGFKEVAAEKTLELRILKKKHARRLGRHRMGYAASEKLEIIKVLESSHLPVKKPLDKLGVVSRPTSNRWYDQYL